MTTANSGNLYIDALAGWSWPYVGRDNHITYYFDNAYGQEWTAAEKNTYQLALQSWANVANFTIEQVSDPAQADLVENKITQAQMVLIWEDTFEGYHTFPRANGPANGFYNTEISYWSDANAGPGAALFTLFVHELGHAIGVAHPHDTGMGSGVFPGVTVEDSSDHGDNGLNGSIYTVMSYNDFFSGFFSSDYT